MKSRRRVNSDVMRNKRTSSLSKYERTVPERPMKIGLSLLVVVIGLVTLFLLNVARSSQPLAAPASCGCSQPLASNVPCLVSAIEDTFNQKVLDKPQPVYPADAKTA